MESLDKHMIKKQKPIPPRKREAPQPVSLKDFTDAVKKVLALKKK